MSAITPELVSKCPRCRQDVEAGGLVCSACSALVHSQRLSQISQQARFLEEQGELLEARDLWLSALPLLPPTTTQASWIRDHARDLDKDAARAAAPKAENQWARKLGPVGPIAILLAKSKTLLALFKLNFLLSLAGFIAVYWGLWGAKFGIGFAVLILIHEMGHFIDIKRRGLPADMPVFLPGLGAYVRWRSLGVSEETRAAISLAGPLAGFISAAACAFIYLKTGNLLWAALARSGAWLNVLNLIPVWTFDGGQAATALSKIERLVLLTASLVLWLLLRENVFFLVALGAGWRMFTKDLPTHPSPRTSAYFIAVLTALGFVMRLMPGQGFGR
ncbi:MAG TPA: site-2 protease family protein [Terriglobales bacterium]|nr:site-2 protease family protein [Terriglobales bacterium]